MSAWWEMRCDDGHRWELFIEGDEEPTGEGLACPKDGRPAVTAMRLPLSDRAVIRILPMAWEREGVAGKSDEYLLEIRSSVNPERFHQSNSSLSWDQVIRYAAMLRGIPWAQAERRWERIRIP